MVSMLGAASRSERKATRRRGALLGAAICALVLAVGTGVAQAAAPTVANPFIQSTTPTGANVGAIVNPGGVDTTVHVDYGTTDAYGSSTDPQTLTASTDDQFISFDIAGLDPNTTYHWRLVAENTDGSADSGDQTFTTLPPPSLSGMTSANVDVDRATLKAQIDPGGTNTTYYFEYGTTTAYGSTAPAPPPGTALTSPTQPQAVSATVTGLSDNTTYHWRVVAINDAGTTTGGDHTFTTFAANPGANTLPDGRVYELVSPFNTVGADLLGGWGWPDGDHAILVSVGSFADQTNGVVGEYVTTRTPNGWDTRSLADPAKTSEGVFMLGAGDDLAHVFVQSVAGLIQTSPAQLVDRSADGSHTALATLDNNTYLGNSGDGSAVLITHNAGTPPLLPDDTHTSGSMLYRTKNDTLQVAGLVENNQVPDCGAVFAGGQFGGARSFLQSGISTDGDSYVFQSPDPSSGCPDTSDLYLRHNGESINISRPAAPEPDQPATFLGGNQDLTKVFFSTAASLEPSDTNSVADIYEYDVAANQLTRITTGSAGDDDANVSGAIVSPDGTHVYFTAFNAFNGEGTDNAANLWLWEDGDSLNFIRTMTDGISLGGTGSFINGVSSTTPDGRFLLFGTTESLTGFDNTDANGNRVPQIFRYSESANDFVCVSCNPAGGTPSSQGPQYGVSTGFSFPNARAMSDDGRYIVFNALDRLVPRDRNSKLDVYRWHDGDIALVSSGASDQDSTAQNISASGRDIFFTSTDRLTPGIGQDNIKMFDARIGGGLPAPIGPAPVKHCSGDGCQGQASPPPPAPSAASAAFEGSGNSNEQDSEPDQTMLKVATISKAAIANWAKTGKLSLKVTLGAGGKVTAKATALLPRHKKASSIASASRTAKKAGTVTLSLKMSKTSRAALRQRSLKVKLVVNSSGAAGPKTTNLTLKRRRGSARGAAAAAAARNYGPTRG
jgi:hypothetical protein